MKRLVRRRGGASRESAAHRARHVRAQLGVAADIAIQARRRALAARRGAGAQGADERAPRGRVTVDDVLACAHQHFGLTSIPREEAAAVLRARYELRGCHRDLDTDAPALAPEASRTAVPGT
ncbi:hypothetical protein [Streptomyces leeuwenhoekii]|uniref:Uncharacterized protein n=2 Tax=Streptomyces leeuwenhoekii TaxID=1437453 RepID=A0A0F7VQZ8_STRLW|nr:hypothetical protein [Streptomyces leeuwenhoekii]CQR59912.1 Hypothetical Protein sle_04500 [Streptomyces leeuwenhoekii]